MKNSTLFALALTLGGCVQGTLSDSLSVSEDMTFVPPSLSGFSPPICSTSTVFTTTQSTTIDVHDPLSQLKKQGTLTVAFTENALSGDLSSFKHARIYVNNDNQPQQLLSETDFTPVNGVVPLPILLDNNTLVDMLSAGVVNITVDLSTCVPTSAVDIHYTMGANLLLNVKK